MNRPSPLADKLVVLVGGSGFVGTHVAQELLRRGARVRVAARNPEKAFNLKPLANLGQVQFARCDVKQARSVEACVAGADAAVYLVGTFGADQKVLQAKSAGVAAAAAAQGGAQAFVYVSAIGADPHKASGYARTKGEGEELVKAAFPQATVIRPSIVFGEEGGIIPMFAGLVAAMPVLPVFGPNAKIQPVWVDDLAAAIANALENPARHGGKTYEAAGPEALTMLQLNAMIGDAQRRERTLLPVPNPIARIFAKLPGTPMNSDQYTMLEEGSVASSGTPQIDALGVTPRPLGLFLDKWMVRYRRHGRFGTDGAPA